MQKKRVSLPSFRLCGIKVRTSYTKELDAQTSLISLCVQTYFHGQLAQALSNRVRPGVTYSAYCEYQTDYKGEYTYFIGEEVDADQDIPHGFTELIVPGQTYVRYTTDKGPMPTVVHNAWRTIWKESPADLGGARAYHVDFEVYDERAENPQATILDVYVGVVSKAF